MKKSRLIIIFLCLVMFCFTACTRQPASRQDAVQKVLDNMADVPTDASPTQGEQEPEQEQPAPQTPAKDKTVLKIAGVGCSESKIKMVINEFNKTDSDYMVSLTDYGVTGTAEQGKMKLQAQMMAGKAPDMLLFDKAVSNGTSSGNALSPLSYLSSGMLLDLDELIASDPELTADDFIIWDALHEFGGMYVIGPKFYVHGLYCLPETAERYQGWTLDDYLALQNSLTEGQKLMYHVTPESFLRNVGRNYIHKAVDVKHATCDFDNAEFIAILNAASLVQSYSAEEDQVQPDGSFMQAQELMMRGKLLFSDVTLRDASDVSFDSYCAAGPTLYDPSKDAWKGEQEAPLAYIGYPTPDGSNGMYVEMPYTVGICAGTEKADGCWEFIRYMLEHPIYQQMWDGTPVLERLLPENLESVIKNTEQVRWVTNQEHQDILVALAKDCTKMAYFDEDVLGIIQEEAAEVLAGKKTAEDAAKMIQNRASVLVMEQYG